MQTGRMNALGLQKGALGPLQGVPRPWVPSPPPPLPVPQQQRRHRVRARIHIDRRAHLENSWRRQEERSRLMSLPLQHGQVTEIQNLEHLESVLEKAGSQLLVVCLYSRSCGACKLALARLETLCAEASRARVRALFARHDVIDEYDSWSDVARWHSARVVPTFLYFAEGALVARYTLRDVRRLRGPPGTVQAAVAQDLHGIGEAFRQVVFRTAPGAWP